MKANAFDIIPYFLLEHNNLRFLKAILEVAFFFLLR